MFVAILFVFTDLRRAAAAHPGLRRLGDAGGGARSSGSVKTLTPAMRGQILDTNGQVLADSVERFTIAADPKVIPAYP